MKRLKQIKDGETFNLMLGDSLERLRELEANSVVTDPPYFLTNSGGSGFMGKEWDSLSVANALAESVLRFLSPVWLMAGESTAQESVNMPTPSGESAKNIHALYVKSACIASPQKLSLDTFSVQESVLTRAEVLVLSRALSPSLTSVFESQPENVLYVINNSFTGRCPRSIAQDVALRLVTEKVCAELEILHSLMAAQKTSGHIGAMTGSKFDSKFTSATSSDVRSVENTVAAKRYNATTSSPIEFQKTIRWITSLRFVRNATALFMANPGNIQILSERFHYQWAKEVFRVLKPGGHILAFAGTRTYHPLVSAIQGAGFEIRDQVQWLYGSGFPKGIDVSKAIDKEAGVEREVLGDNPNKRATHANGMHGSSTFKCNLETAFKITAPATPQAKRWQGFGTTLKPAFEPIVLARKPLERGLTVAANVLKWGCGAINVDASRIEGVKPEMVRTSTVVSANAMSGKSTGATSTGNVSTQGRWPANVLFDESAAAGLDAANVKELPARYFYCAKASKRERNAGLEGEVKQKQGARPNSADASGEFPDHDHRATGGNNHPTVKPVKLMEYLVRMITPPGGVCLDPFMGSGSTGVACVNLGFNFIGVERDEQYLEIAKRRVAHAELKEIA